VVSSWRRASGARHRRSAREARVFDGCGDDGRHRQRARLGHALEHAADAERDGAMDLARDDRGIDQPAAVVRDVHDAYHERPEASRQRLFTTPR